MPSKTLGRVLPLYRGAYDATDAYSAMDIVTYAGNDYAAIGTVSGISPLNPNYWRLYAKGAVAPIVEYGYSQYHGLRIMKHLNLFSNAVSALATVCWPWVIRADDKIENPLGRYYMYYSTDHAVDGPSSGIALAYSDDLYSGWKDYGLLFYDSRSHTETPSVMWDEVNACFICYFHCSGTEANEGQTSYYRTSGDGITFDAETQRKVLSLDYAKIYGNAHNGYFHPFRVGNLWVAYHLLGGNNAGQAVSYSEDGYAWVTDHNQLGYFCIDESGHSLYAQTCAPVHVRGMDWLIGTMSDFTSGTQAKQVYPVIVPIHDLYTPIGKPIKLFDLDDTNFESANLRSMTVFQDGENAPLHIFYQCDNIINCAVLM